VGSDKPLLNTEMHDGSRMFATLPETHDLESPQWHLLRNRIEQLPGARLEGFLTDDVTEAWIDFAYRGHQFSLNNQGGEWWFFVTTPSCPDDVLRDVVEHFEPTLGIARRRQIR